MLRALCVIFALCAPVVPVMAQYYQTPVGPIYNTPHAYPHHSGDYRPRDRGVHRHRTQRQNVVWRPHRVVIEFRAHPRRASAAYRPHRRGTGYGYVPAPAYHAPYSYRQQPTHGYQPQPAYPAPGYRSAPRAISSAGAAQDSACARIANPVSRRACHCTVVHGGIATVSGHGQVSWRQPAGGGGNLALQQCKAGY